MNKRDIEGNNDYPEDLINNIIGKNEFRIRINALSKFRNKNSKLPYKHDKKVLKICSTILALRWHTKSNILLKIYSKIRNTQRVSNSPEYMK